MSDPHIRHDGSDRDDMFICLICRTGSMHRNQLQSHLDGFSHRQSLRDECLKDRAKRVDGALIMYQIESLGLPLKWTRHIKAELCNYIFDSGLDVSRVIDGSIPSSLQRLMKKYKKLEETSLLELASWKASCLWFDGSLNFHTMQDILDQWAMDENFDPVAYKAERRFTRDVSVIVRGVMAYLE